MIQLHRDGLRVSASPAEIRDLARQFVQKQAIVLPQFLEPGLLRDVRVAVERARFAPRRHGELTFELCMAEDALAVHMLRLLTNNPRLFAFIEAITDCGPIGSYEGRIYRLPPNPEYFNVWHSDLQPGRRIGMSINLGAEPYQGGILELREHGRLLGRFPNTTPGNALVFPIREGLQHHVTSVQGSIAKTAFAGWFIDRACGQPYLELLRGEFSRGNRRLVR